MLAAYVDESEDQDDRWVAAVIVRAERREMAVTCLDEVMRRLTDRYPHVPADAELHAHEIFNRHGAWADIPIEQLIALYEAALGCLESAGARFVYHGHVAWSAPQVPVSPDPRKADLYAALFGSKPAANHRILMVDLFEGLDAAFEKWGEVGFVRADEHHLASAVAADLDAFRAWLRSTGRESRIDGGLVFTSSASCRLIQGADLAAFLHRRRWKDLSDVDARLIDALGRLGKRVDRRMESIQFDI